MAQRFCSRIGSLSKGKIREGNRLYLTLVKTGKFSESDAVLLLPPGLKAKTFMLDNRWRLRWSACSRSLRRNGIYGNLATAVVAYTSPQ